MAPRVGLGTCRTRTRSIRTAKSRSRTSLSAKKCRVYYLGKAVSYGSVLASLDMPYTSRNVSHIFSRSRIFSRLTYILDSDEQVHPAGRHVPQSSGEPSQGIPAWIASDPEGSLDNTDVVVWHTFGLNHFPAPEDYPVMPAEPMIVLLRPRNFFTQNPALDVPPSFSSTPSQVAAGKTGIKGIVDNLSRLAFGGSQEKSASKDCECE